jgi:hypothetical protein
MLTLGGWRIVSVDEDGVEAVTDLGELWAGPALPDLPSSPPALTDPATLGCMLALVREAWGWPHVYVCRVDLTGWKVVGTTTVAAVHCERVLAIGSTKARVLVAALEAAP